MFNASRLEERKLKGLIIDEYRDVAAEAMKILDYGFVDSIVIMNFPSKNCVPLRTCNIIERENKEIKNVKR